MCSFVTLNWELLVAFDEDHNGGIEMEGIKGQRKASVRAR